MKNRLLTKGIWAAARKAKEHTPGRTVAAVAYVTDNALGLGKGDVLVCDASEERIKTGATSAKVLYKLAVAGVAVHHAPRLHAKLVRMPSAVLVGSSNMTANTIKLQEASLLSADPAVLTQADKVLQALLDAPGTRRLSMRDVKRLLAIPIERKGGGSANHACEPADADNAGDRLWITRCNPMSGRRATDVSMQIGAAMGMDSPYRGYPTVFSPREPNGSRLRLGDRMIIVDADGQAMAPFLISGIYRLTDKVDGRAATSHAVTTKRFPSRSVTYKTILPALQRHRVWGRATRPPLLLLQGAARREVLALLKARAKPI